MNDAGPEPGSTTPLNTSGCLIVAPIFLGLVYLGIRLTEFLGWAAWPVPVLSLALIALLLTPMKSAPHTNLPGGAKVVAGLVAIIVILVWIGRDRTDTKVEPERAPAVAASPRAAPVVASEPIDAAPVSPPAPPPAPLVTAVRILEDYDENQIRAQSLYDRQVRISGRVVRVREALGTGILVLQTGDADRPLDLYFTERGERDLLTVRARSTVVASCGGVIEMAGMIAMSDCTAVSPD